MLPLRGLFAMRLAFLRWQKVTVAGVEREAINAIAEGYALERHIKMWHHWEVRRNPVAHLNPSRLMLVLTLIIGTGT